MFDFGINKAKFLKMLRKIIFYQSNFSLRNFLIDQTESKLGNHICLTRLTL